MEDEAVEHPGHYAKGGVECITAIKAAMGVEAYRGFLKGNIMKYVWRYESKEKPLQDLQKAGWYLKELINDVSSR